MPGDFRFQLTKRGHVLSRESSDLEFKESFQLGDKLLEYLRTLVGMANNKGGKIVFGVKDSPRTPVGLQNNKFENFDPKYLTTAMLEYFSPEINYEVKNLEFNGKSFGQIAVFEATVKPIICKKSNSNNKLREGAIYYRYRGETREIAYPELSAILENEKSKERELWMKNIKKMSDIGPANVQILDVYRGELIAGEQKLLIDKDVIKQIKFLREGHFVEKDGSPALILKGTIEGFIDQNNIVSSNVIFNMLTTDLQEKFSLNSYQMKCVIWRLKLKENPEMHEEIKTGISSKTHKYSQKAVDLIDDSLKSDANFISTACSEYHKSKSKK